MEEVEGARFWPLSFYFGASGMGSRQIDGLLGALDQASAFFSTVPTTVADGQGD